MNDMLLYLLASPLFFRVFLLLPLKIRCSCDILNSVFINAAGYLLILGVGFVGISYIIFICWSYHSIILFVLMSINIKLTDILEAGSQYTKNIR